MSGPVSFRFGQNALPRTIVRELEEPESGIVPTRQPHLLVVESDRLDQALINVLLRKAGFETAERDFTATVAEALQLLPSRTYSHILIDVGAPDLDAKVLLNELTSLSPETPVIFLANQPSSDSAADLIRAGADDYVVKEELDGRMFRQILAHSSERRRAHRRLIYALQHDLTSGLPNWNLFSKHWAPRLRSAFEGEKESGLLVLRLENFGRVVATLGTVQSQQLVTFIGERLEQLVGRHRVAHLGGERFVACLRVDDETTPSHYPHHVLGMLRDALALQAKGIPLVLRAGLAINSVAGPDMDNLLAAAYEAVEEAERSNRELQLFDSSLATLTARRRDLELGLREAIIRNELSLHYQPKVDLTSGRIVGTEALMRWTRGGQAVGPVEFIPLLERSGLIQEFGTWALQKACLQEATWRRDGVDLGPIAVNLSERQLRDPGLVDLVRRTLEETGVPADRLQLELTESSLVGDVDVVVETMRELKALGVKFGLDDFGTGYSSMSYLQHLPFDVLKIDRSFVMNLGTIAVSRTIAEGIVALGRALDMYIVAEGVETREQLAVLRQIRCHCGQGYLFSRPLPPDELALNYHGSPNQ